MAIMTVFRDKGRNAEKAAIFRFFKDHYVFLGSQMMSSVTRRERFQYKLK